MTSIRGITVCVSYADLLAISLPYAARHLTSILVVTHPDDHATKAVVADVPNASVFETDAFYRHGAKFNKGLAIEEGFDAMGRDGWICIFDADTIFPDRLKLPPLRRGYLYGPPRLILEDPKLWTPQFNWSQAKPTFDREFPGYFQLFHAKDQHIRELPWYDVTFTHAGGGDGYFQSRWPARNKIRLSFNVLHLGPRDTNWFGRQSPLVDGTSVEDADKHRNDMEEYLHFRGWQKRKRTVQKFTEHVNVPGQKSTGYIP